MAEQEKRTFKWGDKEYLLDDLLSLHADQENHFYDFARNRGSYDDNALAGLRKAVSSRIDSVKAGKAFDGDGVLDTDVVDNVSIETQKRKGLTKKTEYVHQDNTEWAKHYLNKLVANLTPYEKEQAQSKWDISKHGLAAYLTGQGLNAEDIFSNYDKQDPNNPTSARGFAQRRALLKQHLPGYKAWLESKGFDFTKNDNEWDDNFGTDFETFVNEYSSNENYDNNALTAALRKFGAGDAYTTAFTSDRWDLSKTTDQTSQEAATAEAARKAEEERNRYNTYITGVYGTFRGLSDNNLGGKTYFTTFGDGMFPLSDSEYEKWLQTHTTDKDEYMRNLQASYRANPFDTKLAAEYLPLADRFGGLKEVTIDGKTYKYDPGTIDRSKNRFVAFDPESGEIRHAFLGDIEEEKAAFLRKWRIDNGYANEADKYTISAAEGGILTMQTGGNFNLAQAVNRDLEARNLAHAAETGNSPEVQKARDRVVSNGDDSFTSEDPMIMDQNTGFTGAERARLVSIAADIGSMFLDPITGTTVGMGSSLLNFGADIADDGFQWSDVGNLGISLGFDLLGAIPILGDAVGTGTKITRQLVKWAPRIMTGLAAWQGASNFGGMMESWRKLTSEDKDQKLTVQDWRNIAQSISLVTGATRAIKNKAAQNSMKNKARVDDMVGVNVRDKSTGEIKQILLDGDTAKRVRQAQGKKADIENILGELEDFKGMFGENGSLEVNTKAGGLQKPWEKINNADGSTSRQIRSVRSEGRADVSDVYDFSRVPQGYGESVGYKIPVVSDYLNKKHTQFAKWLNRPRTTENHTGAMTSAQIDENIAKLRADEGVDAEIENLKNAMAARTARQGEISQELSVSKNKLQDIQNKLIGAPDAATLETDKIRLNQDITNTDAAITTREQLIKQAEKDLSKLLNKRRVAKKNKRAHQQAIRSARARVQGHRNVLTGLQSTRQQNITAVDLINKQLQAHSELPGIQAEVNRLNGIKSRLTPSTHTNAYARLQQLLNDFQINHSNIGGRDINWDMAEILTKAGITNAFEQGGTINRNKISKFLTYAKR